MKIASKMLMTSLLLLAIALPLRKAYAMAQISLQNNSNFWLYLYIDGNFGCGPTMPNGFCTSSVTPGTHLLEARKGGDPSTTIMSEKGVNIGDGTSPTWTVNYEDPNQALIKRLDGTRYVNRWNAAPHMEGEDELTIRGTTLIWRNRVIWASPEVRQAILSGTGGFRNHTIGTWEEFGQMQIVEREAHYHRKLAGSEEDSVYIISEDGNSITLKKTWNGKVYTDIFSRQ